MARAARPCCCAGGNPRWSRPSTYARGPTRTMSPLVTSRCRLSESCPQACASAVVKAPNWPPMRARSRSFMVPTECPKRGRSCWSPVDNPNLVGNSDSVGKLTRQRLGALGSPGVLCRVDPPFAKWLGAARSMAAGAGDRAGDRASGYDEGPGRERNPALRHTCGVRCASVRRPSWSPRRSRRSRRSWPAGCRPPRRPTRPWCHRGRRRASWPR
jgi:hypothetical protein